MTEVRRIAVLTTGRQDYGILRSTLLELERDARFELLLWVGGTHLSRAHGYTADHVAKDGFDVTSHIDFLADAGDSASRSARTIELVAAAIERDRPDALVLLGDRFETLSAGLAATLATTPIVHLHGGEETRGAIDDSMRHALTKLSHLHLVSHELHARRVRQMGESPGNVVVVGAPGLDNLVRDDLPTGAELEDALGIRLDDPVVLVTMHPATLGADAAAELSAVITAMEDVPATYVVTQPNIDAGNEALRAMWRTWTGGRAGVLLVDALGERNYWGLLRVAAAVLGNSSSGIIEAPAAGLPVVNVGDRQAGRLRSPHVRDVPAEAGAIRSGLREALESSRRAAARAAPSSYPAPPAAPRIVEAIARWNLPRPPRKSFHLLEGSTP